MIVSMVVSLVLVIFITVIFDIAHGLNMLNIAPLRNTAAEALISSSPVVQEGSPEYK